MKIRPILFSTPMVQALLAGTKTQTRRVVKPSDLLDLLNTIPELGKFDSLNNMQYGRPGDVFYVRETWAGPYQSPEADIVYQYKTDEATLPTKHRWKSGRFMPKEAARIWLRITDVRVERLQDISEADAIAEGVDSDTQRLPYSTLFAPIYRDYTVKEKGASSLKPSPFCLHSAVTSYGTLWSKINGPGSWAANPWVWAITFERCEKP